MSFSDECGAAWQIDDSSWSSWSAYSGPKRTLEQRQAEMKLNYKMRPSQSLGTSSHAELVDLRELSFD